MHDEEAKEKRQIGERASEIDGGEDTLNRRKEKTLEAAAATCLMPPLLGF